MLLTGALFPPDGAPFFCPQLAIIHKKQTAWAICVLHMDELRVLWWSSQQHGVSE
jgi:hypothetical protein